MVHGDAERSAIVFLILHRFLASTTIFVAMLRRLDYRVQGQWIPQAEEGAGLAPAAA